MWVTVYISQQGWNLRISKSFPIAECICILFSRPCLNSVPPLDPALSVFVDDGHITSFTLQETGSTGLVVL